MNRILTYQYRIKDSSKALKRTLLDMAFAVNQVWNFCNETQKSAIKWGKRWPGEYDLCELTAGVSKDLGIQSGTVQRICSEYVIRRQAAHKRSLRWRSSRKHLPWIPFKANGISVNREAGSAKYYGLEFSYWNSRPLIGTIKCGSICADSRGRFYLNITCEVPDLPQNSKDLSDVGIDLGLKDVITTSTGKKAASPGFYRRLESKIAAAQRAKKAKQFKNLNAKVKNQRKDFNHKISTDLAVNFKAIFVGDISSSDIAQKSSGLAKSVYDASWYQLKTLLKYKALARGVTYLEVNEAYSTQTCSECGCIPASSPKGRSGLIIREWTCSECGATHDRDINAAKNILRFGHESLIKQSSTKTRKKLALSGIPGL